MLLLDTRSVVPIWKQIEDGIRRLVATGLLEPGSAVPSVRDLAKKLQVNPATVSRAYQNLTEEGYLAVRRGEGTFIAEVLPAPTRSEQRRVLKQAAAAFVTTVLGADIDEDQAIEEIRSTYRRLRERKRA